MTVRPGIAATRADKARHVAGDIFCQLDHPARFDAGSRFQFIHGHHRARTNGIDRALDVEIVEHGLQQASIALQPGLVDDIIRLLFRRAQQVDRGQRIGAEEITLFAFAKTCLFRR